MRSVLMISIDSCRPAEHWVMLSIGSWVSIANLVESCVFRFGGFLRDWLTASDSHRYSRYGVPYTAFSVNLGYSTEYTVQ